MSAYPEFLQWYRSATAGTDHDKVAKRFDAISELVDESPGIIMDLVSLAYALPSCPPKSKKLLTDAVFNKDNSFDAGMSGNEVAILAGCAVAHFIKSAGAESDATALALTLPQRLYATLTPAQAAIGDFARKHLRLRAREVRSCRTDEDFTSPKDPIGKKIDPAKITNHDESLVAVRTQIAPNQVELSKELVRLYAIVQGQQAAMKYFREESDLLWWMYAGRSYAADKVYNDVAKNHIPLFAGADVATVVSSVVLPDNVSEIMLQVLRRSKCTEVLSLVDCVRGLAAEQAKALLGDDDLSPGPLTPVLAAMKAIADGTNEWQGAARASGAYDLDKKLPASDLAMQVLQERVLLKHGI